MKVAARKLFRKRMLPAYENGGIVSGMDMPPPPPMGMDTGAMPPPTMNTPEAEATMGVMGALQNVDQQLDMVGDDPEGVIQALTGKSVPEARNDLAGIVGLPDAQQTPDSVLALVQPTLLMAEQAAGMEQGGIQTLGMDEPPPTMDMAGVPPDPFPQAALGDPSNPIAAPTVEVPAARFGGYVQGFSNGGLNEALNQNPYTQANFNLKRNISYPGRVSRQEFELRKPNPFVTQDQFSGLFNRPQATSEARNLIDIPPSSMGGSLGYEQAMISAAGGTTPELISVGVAEDPSKKADVQGQDLISPKTTLPIIDTGQDKGQDLISPKTTLPTIDTGQDKVQKEILRQKTKLEGLSDPEEILRQHKKMYEGILEPDITLDKAKQQLDDVYGDPRKDLETDFWLSVTKYGAGIANSPGKTLLEAAGAGGPEFANDLMKLSQEVRAVNREKGIKAYDLHRDITRLRRTQEQAITKGAIDTANEIDKEVRALNIELFKSQAVDLESVPILRFNVRQADGTVAPYIRTNGLRDKSQPHIMMAYDDKGQLITLDPNNYSTERDDVTVVEEKGLIKTIIKQPNGQNINLTELARAEANNPIYAGIGIKEQLKFPNNEVVYNSPKGADQGAANGQTTSYSPGYKTIQQEILTGRDTVTKKRITQQTNVSEKFSNLYRQLEDQIERAAESGIAADSFYGWLRASLNGAIGTIDSDVDVAAQQEYTEDGELKGYQKNSGWIKEFEKAEWQAARTQLAILRNLATQMFVQNPDRMPVAQVKDVKADILPNFGSMWTNPRTAWKVLGDLNRYAENITSRNTALLSGDQGYIQKKALTPDGNYETTAFDMRNPTHVLLLDGLTNAAEKSNIQVPGTGIPEGTVLDNTFIFIPKSMVENNPKMQEFMKTRDLNYKDALHLAYSTGDALAIRNPEEKGIYIRMGQQPVENLIFPGQQGYTGVRKR